MNSDANRFSITARVSIALADVEWSAIRASGPGGQNVNKVASAVQLRYRLEGIDPLPEDVLERLRVLAGSRLTKAGEILVDAREYRTQEANLEAAMARLRNLIEQALHRPKPRRATKPTKGSQERRIAGKKQRGTVKGMRGRVKGEG
ncbi:MAG: aminoacyl-tRNA hydrolase [Alphaproteobacteria bacterium CG_4_10_14_0_2_um_filter_63_37]|nr:MAG: aminoacyl-tRNA hydrolase [Alphaproteobacteria bacterium CG_4_10_14_0_2_um_filter_63_37]